MEAVEITLYSYADLADGAKAVARDWYRQGALDYDWWETVYADFEEVCERLGVSVIQRRRHGSSAQRPAIYFSGFSSQGDGACFEAYYRYKKAGREAMRGYAPKDLELHRIADALFTVQRRNFYQLHAATSHRGRYYHEHCMTVDVGRRDVEMTADAEDEIAEALRDLARWLYRQLEAEHDYLLSDEAVAESIAANEYRFRASGAFWS